MATAYTPGLTVSANATIVKTRRLPLKGDVLVGVGETVKPDTVVARALLPGILVPHRISAALGIDPAEVPTALKAAVGEMVTKGQLLAETRGLWGLFHSDYRALTTGSIEIVSPVSGNVGVREAPTPVEVNAYVPGTVRETMAGEGVVIEARGALVQGIFGVGGERRAPLKRVVNTPDAPLTENDITPDCAGYAIIGGTNVTLAALHRAAEVGVTAVIAGGIIDTDLVDFLGHDIGVAITGHEAIPLTLILTEGFGTISMATRTFDLLGSLEGREASLSGATQIRAGVLRPEIVVAEGNPPAAASAADHDANTLAPGTAIRLIREPYFGRLATVVSLPPQLVRLDSGAEVRVLIARLNDNSETVTVPRANVEIVVG